MLKNIQSHLSLTYLNNDEHTHLDRAKGCTDILDMAFISPNLTKYDIQFLIGDDLGNDHLPIEISIDAQLYRNTHTNPVRYKFDSIFEKCFDILGILKMAPVKFVEPGNNSFSINHIIRCRFKFLPLGFSKFVLVLIL